MSSVLAAQAAPRPAWKELWLITIGHGLTHWYPATFYLLLPLIGAELGLSYSQIGLIMTCQYIASAVANVPGGILVDTVGRKGLLMAISLFWVGFPYLLISFTHSYAMLLVCIALVGFGNSLWHPTAIPTLARRYPERKGLVLSLHGMGGNVGDAIAPLVAGAALAIFSWRQVVVMNVAPGLIVAALMLVFLGSIRLGAKPAQVETQSLRDYLRGLRELLRNRSLVLLSTGSAFRTMTQTALLTFLPVYLAHDLGYSPAWVGACLFLLQAAGFAAAPLAGHLSDRMGRKHILVGSMLSSGAVLGLMAVAGALCHAAGDPGLAARDDAEEHGRLEHRRAVRRAGGWRIARAAARRHGRGPVRPARDFLSFRRHDRVREPVRFLGSGRARGFRERQEMIFFTR